MVSEADIRVIPIVATVLPSLIIFTACSALTNSGLRICSLFPF